MKILLFSTLYPNGAMPNHGVFVETRLRQLVAGGGVAARVVAPVPWFPSQARIFGSYGTYARVPGRETRHDIDIVHPRYPVVPKLGMTMAPALLYLGARAAIRGAIESGFDFDLIDAHYFYPDGVAAVMLGRHFGKPVTITARGTDINLIPDHLPSRRQILWAARQCDAMIAVCQALKDRMVELGIAESRISVLRNGVDLALFRPTDRDRARARLGLTGPTVVSVGHLVPRKGHDIAIRAVARLPGVRLIVVGTGPEDSRLRKIAAAEGVGDRVDFVGGVEQARLPDILTACDALVLASSREGWANVLLEAMACGTPVVASAVWGTPEVVTDGVAGLLVGERTPPAFAAAIGRLLAAPPDRAATRAYAENFGWDATSRGQRVMFESILGCARAPSLATVS